MRIRLATLLCTPWLCAASAFGQGHFAWPDPLHPLEGMLIRTAADRYLLYFPGWTTHAPGAGDGGTEQAAAIGVPTGGVIRRVSAVEFVDEESGDTAENVPLFAFAASATTTAAFTALRPGLLWSGFVASLTQPVPGFVRGVLAFDLDSADTPANVIAVLSRSVIAVAEANPDGSLTGARQQLLGAPQVTRARVLYYKFDRGAGDIELNYESFGAVPRIGHLSGSGGQPWSGGRFGSALRGGTISGPMLAHNFCDTGFGGGLFGTFTVAWFMRERTAPGAMVSHLFGEPAGFRCFTGGAAGTGLRCAGWGGAPLPLAVDVQAAARVGWVHVALVVDAGPGRAIWYVNGQPRPPLSISAAVSIPDDGSPLLIGSAGSATSASVYDIDEFRLVNAAASATVIQSWAQRSDAAATTLGTTCGSILRHVGGAPASPNPGYALRTEGPAGRPYAVLVGTKQTIGAIPLPFPLGTIIPALAGCSLYSDVTLTLPGATGASGLGFTPFAIPAGTARIALYNQVLMLGASSEALLSNAHASSIE